MIIDVYNVKGVTLKELPLNKFLRFTECSWYELSSFASFTLVDSNRAKVLESVYQERLRKA